MKILVVDDHAMFAESIKLLLASHHQIATAIDGKSAIAHLTSESQGIVLLDQHLPDIDGITLLKVIRALPSPPPVILLSGNQDSALMNTARQSGAAGFLHKSLPAEALLKAIEKVANGQTVWPNVSDHQEPADTEHVSAMATKEVNAQLVQELGITERQIDVLQLLVAGLPNKSIASQLGIAESTVKTHIKCLFQALKVNNRVACHNRATELSLLR